MRTLLVTLEGNIGAGKSTALATLQSRLQGCTGFRVVMEPADEWLERGFLQGVYRGEVPLPSFQHMVLTSLTSRLAAHVHDSPRPLLIVTERSPFSNLHVFAKLHLSGVELELYEHSWKDVVAMFESFTKVKHVVLEGTVETLLRRIAMRNRSGENHITLTDVQLLQQQHSQWLQTCEQTAYRSVSHDSAPDVTANGVCNAVAFFIREHLEEAKHEISCSDHAHLDAMIEHLETELTGAAPKH